MISAYWSYYPMLTMSVCVCAVQLCCCCWSTYFFSPGPWCRWQSSRRSPPSGSFPSGTGYPLILAWSAVIACIISTQTRKMGHPLCLIHCWAKKHSDCRIFETILVNMSQALKSNPGTLVPLFTQLIFLIRVHSYNLRRFNLGCIFWGNNRRLSRLSQIFIIRPHCIGHI